jgi:hypothetical protein
MKAEPQYGVADEPPAKAIKLIGNIEEKNLTVEWNDWHNKFAKAVRQHMFSSYFEMLNMKQGLSTSYRCTVTSDKHIKSVNIVKSSGDFWFDSRVVKAVNVLDGSDVLAFPSQSKRTEISTEVGIQLGGPRRQEIDFGDVEYREMAPGEQPAAPPAESAKTESTEPANTRHHHRD